MLNVVVLICMLQCYIMVNVTVLSYGLCYSVKLWRVPRCEPFELKLGMSGQKGLLTNFPKFHGDLATSTMLLQHCRQTYRTDLVLYGLSVSSNRK